MIPGTLHFAWMLSVVQTEMDSILLPLLSLPTCPQAEGILIPTTIEAIQGVLLLHYKCGRKPLHFMGEHIHILAKHQLLGYGYRQKYRTRT